jgi:hypothetical protein
VRLFSSGKSVLDGALECSRSHGGSVVFIRLELFGSSDIGIVHVFFERDTWVMLDVNHLLLDDILPTGEEVVWISRIASPEGQSCWVTHGDDRVDIFANEKLTSKMIDEVE